MVLLDTYSSYFEYLMSCICGIPRITLEGASEDWQRIRARVEVLETFELGWWVSRLRPILDEFVLAAEGRPTREFWQAIYKPKKAYGDDVITGWITDLFPYLGDPPRRSRNAVLNTPRNQWALAVEKGIKTGGLGYGGPGVPTQSFPSGLSSVPVKFKCRDSTAELDLVAGFFAVEQDASDLSLSPVISWCLTEPAPKKSVVI